MIELPEHLTRELLRQAQAQSCSIETYIERLLEERQGYRDLQAILTASPLSTVFVDRNSQIRAANKAAMDEAQRILGHRTLVGKSIRDFVFPVNTEIFDTYFERALAGEACAIERTTELNYFHLHFEPIRDELDAVTGVCLIAINTTKHKIESALQESLNLYQSLVDVLPLNLYRTNGKRQLTFVNKQVLDELNISLEECIGKTADDFYPPELAAKYHQDDLRVLQGETLSLVEEHFRPSDGQTRYVEVIKTPLYDVNGNITGIQGLFWDVTERVRAEEQKRLQLLLRKEQELNALQSNFIMTLSHELRTPLAIISSSSGLLSQYFEQLSSEQRQDKLEKIQKQINGLSEMLDEISLVVRGVLDQYTLKLKPVNLIQLCEVSIDAIKETTGSRHQFQLVANEQLKTIRLDETLVSRILINLLSNAVKYSSEQSEIRVELRQEQQTVILAISDQGIGISDDEKQYIFDPFFRAKSAEGIKGTGLGLSIVKECIKLHQGEIEVESTLQKGTTFIVHLPSG